MCFLLSLQSAGVSGGRERLSEHVAVCEDGNGDAQHSNYEQVDQKRTQESGRDGDSRCVCESIETIRLHLSPVCLIRKLLICNQFWMLGGGSKRRRFAVSRSWIWFYIWGEFALLGLDDGHREVILIVRASMLMQGASFDVWLNDLGHFLFAI